LEDNHDHQGMSRIINNTRPLLQQAYIAPCNDVIFFMRYSLPFGLNAQPCATDCPGFEQSVITRF